ncbi:hypothetical protein L7F22_058401 [Adiantum nelumboides]|nr:hypothetical protein [Adiantum nelumboides]
MDSPSVPLSSSGSKHAKKADDYHTRKATYRGKEVEKGKEKEMRGSKRDKPTSLLDDHHHDESKCSSCAGHCETYCQAIMAPLGPDSGAEKMQIDECPPPKRAKATDAFSPDFLRLYYDTKHPGCDSSYLGRRKISFTLEHDIYVCYLSNHNANEMESSIREMCPYKIDIGVVYNVDDMTDYDDVRFCRTGADICHKCWPLMTIAIKVVGIALREDFGFEHILWVYIGRRGVHCWSQLQQISTDKLSLNASDFVIEAVPILTNLLQYQDLKVVDHASACLSRIADSFATSADKLDMLCSHVQPTRVYYGYCLYVQLLVRAGTMLVTVVSRSGKEIVKGGIQLSENRLPLKLLCFLVTGRIVAPLYSLRIHKSPITQRALHQGSSVLCLTHEIAFQGLELPLLILNAHLTIRKSHQTLHIVSNSG